MPRLQRLVGLSPKRYFHEFWALENISFEVKKGETVGIVGRNGSGKSTLLQMICGTLNPSQGGIQTYGRIAALLELGSGFNPEFTGHENIFMNASVLGLTKQEIEQRFQKITEFADIGDFINQPVKTYSSGMVVRLAFSVIAHVDADILIVDEALSVGDAFFSQKCMRFLRNFMKTGTVLFVSHDTGAVVNLCNKVIHLEKGQILEIGEPKKIIQKYLATLHKDQHDQDDLIKTELELTETNQAEKTEEYRDMREAMINASNLRNDIEVFQFEPNDAFGTGHAEIISVRLLDETDTPMTWIVGGENVKLEIRARANKELVRPILGFQFKDRLGQVLFCDNTYLIYQHDQIHVKERQEIRAVFEFRLPILPYGQYSFSPAIAEGTQESHVQHQWLHDALIINVHATSSPLGLIGLPMKKITIELIK
jgi:lipopolysaccharide transport system ATP-binding protein